MTSLEILLIVLVAIAAVYLWSLTSRLRRVERTYERELDEQRQRRDGELREQAQRTAALFDRMIEGLIVVDATGRIRLANRAAGELFDFAPPATGKTIIEATRHHEVAAIVARLDREPEVLGHELRLESLAAPRFFQ